MDIPTPSVPGENGQGMDRLILRVQETPRMITFKIATANAGLSVHWRTSFGLCTRISYLSSGIVFVSCPRALRDSRDFTLWRIQSELDIFPWCPFDHAGVTIQDMDAVLFALPKRLFRAFALRRSRVIFEKPTSLSSGPRNTVTVTSALRRPPALESLKRPSSRPLGVSSAARRWRYSRAGKKRDRCSPIISSADIP